MNLLLGLVHLLVVIAMAWQVRKRFAEHSTWIYWSAFSFKIICGWLVGILYLYYYEANDTWLFFSDATRLAELARTNFTLYTKIIFGFDPGISLNTVIHPLERSFLMVRLISIFNLISFNSYWVCAAYFSLFSFMASWFLFSEVTKYVEKSAVAAAVAFLFFPSVIFWSSGIVKEAIALAGTYFVVAMFLRFCRTNQLRFAEVMAVVISLYLVWGLKYYWAAILVIVLVTTLLQRMIGLKVEWLKNYKVVSWFLLFLSLTIIISYAHPNFYLPDLLQVVVSNHDEFLRISKPKGVIHFYDLEPTWTSVLINSPWALVSGLFRPFILEANGVMGLLAAIENLFLVVLFCAACLRIRNPLIGPHRLLVVALLTYIILLCIFLTLSTPNFGTLSRYRVGFLPFFVFLISFRNPLLDVLISRFPRLKQ